MGDPDGKALQVFCCSVKTFVAIAILNNLLSLLSVTLCQELVLRLPNLPMNNILLDSYSLKCMLRGIMKTY